MTIMLSGPSSDTTMAAGWLWRNQIFTGTEGVVSFISTLLADEKMEALQSACEYHTEAHHVSDTLLEALVPWRKP